MHTALAVMTLIGIISANVQLCGKLDHCACNYVPVRYGYQNRPVVLSREGVGNSLQISTITINDFSSEFQFSENRAWMYWMWGALR